jgi:hypothetical protein
MFHVYISTSSFGNKTIYRFLSNWNLVSNDSSESFSPFHKLCVVQMSAWFDIDLNRNLIGGSKGSQRHILWEFRSPNTK